MTCAKGIVLVVDDDAHSLRSLANILGGQGYGVRQADSVQVAVTSIRAGLPDLVLLDFNMTAVGGIEIGRLLEADEASRAVPLILLCKSPNEEERFDKTALRAADFIGKPPHAAELLARVAMHLELGRLRTQMERAAAQAGWAGTAHEELPDDAAERSAGQSAPSRSDPRIQDQALPAQRLQSIGLLAAGIGHDVNNMLGGIRASLDSLLEDLADPSRCREQLQKVQFTVNRAMEILHELMIYAGEKVTGFQIIDPVPLAEEMVQLLNVSISKRARLSIRCGRDLPAIRANPTQIRQVIMNLIINASEALRGDEGEIFLSLSAAPPSFLDRGIHEWLRLMVCDTGHGMPDEVRERIFDPFFTTKATGRGLGLSAVRGIVRAHGGSISVTSAPDNGCSIEILLPGVPHETTSERDGAQRKAVGGCSTESRVLLIGDGTVFANQ